MPGLKQRIENIKSDIEFENASRLEDGLPTHEVGFIIKTLTELDKTIAVIKQIRSEHFPGCNCIDKSDVLKALDSEEGKG